MFGEKERALKAIDQEPTTILETGCQFEGKLTFEGTVQINGNFRGEIFSDGYLIIGENAQIEASIEVKDLLISGQVRGNINAKERIEMKSPASVKGDIKAPALVIEEGVIFEGNCSMGKKIFQGVEESISSQPVYEFLSQE